MTSNGVEIGVIRRSVDPVFLIYFAAATVSSSAVGLLVWLTGILWIAAAIPVIPAMLAVGLSLKYGQGDRLKELLLSLVNGQVGGRWFATSTLFLPLVAVISIAIYAATGDADLNFRAPRLGMFFAALPLALLNELGWRGFAPLHVSDRRGLFVKSVVIGAAWWVSVSPTYLFGTPLLGQIPIYQLGLAMIPMSILMFWLYANTKALMMPGVFAASGLITVSLLPIMPGDSAQGVTFWLVVGFLWLAAVAVVGFYGTDGLDRSIHELPPDELPVDWDKIMPQARPRAKLASFRAGNRRKRPKPKSFSAMAKRSRR